MFADNEFYIRAEFSLKFLEECNANDIVITGIEGFKIENNEINHVVSIMADYSEVES